MATLDQTETHPNPPLSPLTPPNNSHPTNPCRPRLHVPRHPPWPLRPPVGASLQPSLTPAQTHLLRNLHTLRTDHSRGDSATLRSPGNRLLWLCLGEGSRRTLGHLQGTPQRVTRRNTQNRCGDTNGDTCTLVLYVFRCKNLAEIG